MESNYGSSESNYGYGESSGRSYGGVSSESNYSSESAVERKKTYSSSESRQKKVNAENIGLTYKEWLKTEPWVVRGGLSSDGEMHQAYEEWKKEQEGRIAARKYNNLKDIDKLLERLEKAPTPPNADSEEIKNILAEREQKIKILEELVESARKAEQEEIITNQLKKENDELDSVIESVKRGYIR